MANGYCAKLLVPLAILTVSLLTSGVEAKSRQATPTRQTQAVQVDEAHQRFCNVLGLLMQAVVDGRDKGRSSRQVILEWENLLDFFEQEGIMTAARRQGYRNALPSLIEVAYVQAPHGRAAMLQRAARQACLETDYQQTFGLRTRY
jgi:hypothetical protein